MLILVVIVVVVLLSTRLMSWVTMYTSQDQLEVYRQAGEWAIVTGCTDGIGLEYACSLHARGFSLILVSRTQSKLDALSARLPGSVAVAIDFSTPDYSRLEEILADRRLSLLINNVGSCYDRPAPLHELPRHKMDELINVNIRSALHMTHRVIPHMTRGLVVNISSGSSLTSCPLMSVYSASKAFLNSWTMSMNDEYGGRIRFQSLTPYYITSKLSSYTQENFTIPSPERYVNYSIRTLGRTEQCTGYPVHDLMAWLITHIPRSMAGKLVLEANLNKE